MRNMLTQPVRLAVHSHDRGDFANVRHKNVLLYWPHGFGDWAQFSQVLPFLEPTNRYWITRFGDDSVSLMDGHPTAIPIYLGVNSPHCDDGGQYGIRHFGLQYDDIHGNELELRVPQSLHDVIVREKIEVMLWSSYPEMAGFNPAPYHTKARALVKSLAASFPKRFESPLPRTISLEEDPALVRMAEARLMNFCGYGSRRLCLIGRSGYTAVRKNWGHMWREDLPPGWQREGQECRDFIHAMLARSRHWCFLLMEDRDFGDSLKSVETHTFAYSDVFGEPETAFAPFGRIMKCLVRLASLCVGVPAGPYHLAAQVAELPTVGIWIEHLPCWYDEPRGGLVHVIGKHAAQRIGEAGSFLKCGDFNYDSILLDSRTIPGEAVMSAVESLLGRSA